MVSRARELATCQGRSAEMPGGAGEQEQEAYSEEGQARWQASSEAGQAQVDAVVDRHPGDQCVDTSRARGRQAGS